MLLNESNSTGQSVEWFPGLQTTACVLYTIILIVGLIGNTLVIVVVMKYRDMRNPTNLLLTNLSLADLFLLIFCTADGYQHLYARDEHHLGSFMCSLSPFVQNATSICSVLTIMAISYERYNAICQPFPSLSRRIRVFRTIPSVICFWVLSCIMSAPFFIYTKTKVELSIYNEPIVTCFTHFPAKWSTVYLISCTFCIYLVIFLLLCYWHFSICCILFNREALLRDNTVLTRYRRQVVQLLIVLIILFFVLILPYKIWAIIQHRLTEQQFFRLGFQRHTFIMISTRLLLYINSAINPIVYSIMSTKFRQYFMLLCRECHVSIKNQHVGSVFFEKDNVRHVIGIHGIGGGRTLTTQTKNSSPLQRSRLEEKKSFLADNCPTPVVGTVIDERDFSF